MLRFVLSTSPSDPFAGDGEGGAFDLRKESVAPGPTEVWSRATPSARFGI